jgi:hypothetical protein
MNSNGKQHGCEDSLIRILKKISPTQEDTLHESVSTQFCYFVGFFFLGGGGIILGLNPGIHAFWASTLTVSFLPSTSTQFKIRWH